MKAEKAYRASALIIPLREAEALAVATHRLRAVRVLRRRKQHRYQRIERRILAALEKLEDLRQEFIARLDVIHGDPDIEPGCDDDSNAGGCLRCGVYFDEAEADDADDEPSLAAPEGAQSYTNQRCGSRDDIEEQCDDEGNDGGDREEDPCDLGEPDCDAELVTWPTMGAQLPPNFDSRRPYVGWDQ